MESVDGLDSNCYGTPLEANGPTDELCGNDAVAWVELTSGTHRYLCEDHVDLVERFDEVEVGVVSRVCDRCYLVTPTDFIEFSGGDWLCDDCRE